MKKEIVILIALIFSLFIVSAHQPRYVFNQDNISVENPEVSQAFYGRLEGSPNYYILNSDKEFELYLNILTSDLNDSRRDFIVEIMPINVTLDGRDFNWTFFHEEYAGDNYFSGPAFEENVSAGEYVIKVSNSDNLGKYSLAIGKMEKFSVKDILSLFSIKKNFFDKGYLGVYDGIIGRFLLYATIFLLVIIVVVCFVIARIFKKK